MSAMQNQLQDLMNFCDEDHDGSVDPEVSLTASSLARARRAHARLCGARQLLAVAAARRPLVSTAARHLRRV